MLRLPPFRYLAPETLPAALEALAAAGSTAAVMAGGTDLLPHLKRRQRAPDVLIGLRRVSEVRDVRVDERGAEIGAGCTLASLARHPGLRRRYAALTRTIETIAGPTLREMGTIGGNLCIESRCAYFDLPPLSRAATGGCLKDGGTICLAAPGSARCRAVASSDAAPLLIALDARVRLVRAGGERLIPLAALYEDDGLHPLRLLPGELLTEILLPPPDGIQAAYHKIRRRGTLDFPAASAAVAFRLDPGSRLADTRVVIGGAASAPLAVMGAAEVLSGTHLDEEALSQAAFAAMRAVRPIDNADLTAGWRKHLVGVAVRRAFEEAAQPPGGAA